MKFFLTIPTIAMLIAATFVGAGFSSCTKERPDFKDFKHHPPCVDTIRIGDTIIIRDTVVIKDTMLTLEILTAHPWKFLEVRGVLGGDTVYYLRGGSHNTESFDNEYITFYADKTGSLHDNAGYTHAMISWDFANDEHTKIVFDLYNDNVIHSIYTWDNIRYKNQNLYYDDYFYDEYRQMNAHNQEIRIPLDN